MKNPSLLFLILPLILLCACAKEKDIKNDNLKVKNDLICNKPVYGGTLHLDNIPIDSLNFIGSNSTSANIVIFQLADGLVSQDTKFNYIPMLAERWEVKDSQEVVFYLRKNVEFHDGYPFTADDVVFTFHASLTADFPWGNYAQLFSNVKKCEKIDDYTVKIIYKEKTYDTVGPFVNFFILPKHLYDTKKYTLNNNPANFKPIGTGPFKLGKWEKNSQIVLEANDKYFGGRPYIDKLVFKVLNPDAMRFNMLINNEIDIVPLSSVEWKFKTNSKEFKTNFYKLRYYTLGVFFIGWNCKSSMFSDKKVRQAMAYSVDLFKYNKKVKFGLFKPAATPLHLEVKYCAKDLKPYPYSIEKAKELLFQAGFKENEKGILVDKKGKKFVFNIVASTYSKSFVSFLEYMQGNLAKLGIKMNILLYEDSVYMSKLKNRDFDAFLGGIGTSDDPSFLNYIFGEAGIKLGFNNMSYVNSKCEKLFKKLVKEMDIDLRRKDYLEIQKIIYEDQPWLYLYYPPSLVAINKRIKGFVPSPLGILQTYPGLKDVYISEN